MSARLARAGILLALAAVAGCATVNPTVGPSRPPAVTSPSPDRSAPPVASDTTPPPAGSPDPGASAVARDPSLLGVLPSSVDGVTVSEEPDAYADAVKDPDFAKNVAAAAFPLAVSGSNIASGVVVRLHPGVFNESFFRDWRDSYDHGACEQAGGVTGHAETELGGRTVYITSCAGGLRTYHAAIPERDLIVSLFSVGDRRFGEQLLAGLRP